MNMAFQKSYGFTDFAGFSLIPKETVSVSPLFLSVNHSRKHVLINILMENPLMLKKKFFLSKLTEAVFLVECDPSMNEL